MTDEVRYEFLYPRDVQERLSAVPLAFLPAGLLEWHGDHLPLGTDAIKVHAHCVKLAQRIGGVVLPMLYLGRPGFSTFLGTLTFSHELVSRALLEIFAELEKIGAKVIVLFAGHGGEVQEETLGEATRKFNARGGARVLYLSDWRLVADLGHRGDHGGPWETAMVMAHFPERVRLERFTLGVQDIPRYELPPERERHGFELPSFQFEFKRDVRAEVTPEEAQRRLELVLQRAEREIRNALEGI